MKNASAPTPTLEEFLACCQTECAFLVHEYGFALSPPPPERNEFTVWFRKGELGVEISGENYGASASCELWRGRDQVYLGLLVPAEKRRRTRKKGAPPGQLEQVRIIASVLKEHAADFLSGDCRRFDAALAEWKRVTGPRKVSEEQLRDRERLQAVTLAGHAARRADFAEVVRLLEPYARVLSSHQRRLLETARAKLDEAMR